MPKLRDQRIEGQTIRIEKTSPEMYSFGPNLDLVNCDVIAEGGARYFLTPGFKMTGGSWQQKVRLTSFEFSYAHFTGVRFTGKFEGVTFGDWDHPEWSSVTDCDFTGAWLSGIRLLHGRHEGLRLPPWPCFAVANPGAAFARLRDLDLPPALARTLSVSLDLDPPCTLLVMDAHVVAKRAEMTIDPLRDLLAPLPGLQVAPG